ncbi:MAG: hypothetical protein ACXVYV_07395 [Gaiellales bacterium]
MLNKRQQVIGYATYVIARRAAQHMARRQARRVVDQAARVMPMRRRRSHVALRRGVPVLGAVAVVAGAAAVATRHRHPSATE